MKVKRCFSYHELKKRRVLREQKSRGKLKNSVAASTDLTTEKKNPIFINYNFPQKIDHSQNQVVEIKQLAQSDRSPKTSTIHTHKQQPKTERVSPNVGKQPKMLLDALEQNIFDSKQILKSLLKNEKRNRSVLTLNQLRNKIKEEKQRSRSRSRNQIILEQTPKKLIVKQNKGKQPIRIRKFESIEEKTAETQMKHKRKLKEAPRANYKQSPIKNEQKQEREVKRKQKQVKESPKILDLLQIENDKELVATIEQEKTARKQRKKLEKFKKFLPQALLSIS